ncbi:molybdopterin biosynthesis protein [Miniphocaeibacter halophilus]|uniref:molybdopterin biosynthesis protein n=1 Tax=Miniphocaeibacter halophilus TaxID=2931922 RepID=UPI001FB259DE|nr:molybdopterin biosynthesis protein [Miniphocaeibacter halophilus]
MTSKAVFAKYNSPLYDSAAMDGIAVESKKTIGARENKPIMLKKEDYVVIDTGDPVFQPFDSVIMVENIEQEEDGSVLIRKAAAPWQHIRPVGEDIVQGEMILPSSHKIRPIDIGVLISGGVTEIEVIKKLKVGIYPTGTEMIEARDNPKIGQIIESNSMMFSALIEENGSIPFRHSALPDDYELIKNTIKDAIKEYDMLIINAGSSAGTEDYTANILKEIGEVVVHGVAIKPGKPVILGIVDNKPVIGLPGYPVSAYITYQKFVVPILELMGNKVKKEQDTIEANIARRVVSSIKHEEYIRVKVGKVGERYVAIPLARGAGAAMSLVRADGFCIIDQNLEGLEAGDRVKILLNKRVSELEQTLVSIGSHDLILDIIADMMSEKYPGEYLSSSHVGSMAGLLSLKREEAHMAPIHILDDKTSRYNIPIVKEILGDRPMALIKGVGRIQGIMVQKENKLGIKGIKDLIKHRYINRQRGAGTRIMLDFKLKEAGISPEEITGYDREAATHMAVAVAIKNNSADAGMGILSAAKAVDLDFIPIANEEYDFAIPVENLELKQVKDFIEILKSHEFKNKLIQMGGYSTEKTGEIVIIK